MGKWERVIWTWSTPATATAVATKATAEVVVGRLVAMAATQA